MNTIALINIQIGPFKNYFPLFLKSCEYNEDIDFFFVTDQDVVSSVDNIHVIKTTFDEIKTRIQSLFDFPINLQNPYDLCDYKVTYGELFSTLIKDYDFWGYCDTDMVFGRIRTFLSEEILNSNDKILIRGHFTLFRNLERFNTCYRNPLVDGRKKYIEVFSDHGVHHFDEGLPDIHEGINMIWKQTFGWERVYDKYIFMDLDVYRYQFINLDFVNDEVEKNKAMHSFFRWDNGTLTRVSVNAQGEEIDSEEYMYIHFQKRNMSSKCGEKTEKYYIVPNCFLDSGTNIKRLYNANNNRIYWSYQFDRIKKKVKKMMGKEMK